MDTLDIKVERAEGNKCPRCWHVVKGLATYEFEGKTAVVPCPRCFFIVLSDYPEFIEDNAEEWSLVEKAYKDRDLHYLKTKEWLW
jgi:hypothetical protein